MLPVHKKIRYIELCVPLIKKLIKGILLETEGIIIIMSGADSVRLLTKIQNNGYPLVHASIH